MSNLKVDPTPNPNSIKITLEQAVIDSGSFSASTAAEADAHEVARKRFAVAGVTNVFMSNTCISVNKDPGASWDDLQLRVEEVIRGHFGG